MDRIWGQKKDISGNTGEFQVNSIVSNIVQMLISCS